MGAPTIGHLPTGASASSKGWLVVLLLGATYGAPDASGKSITEREFDTAVRAGIPVLAYRLTGDEAERAAAFRARVETSSTIGTLTGSPALDAARIVADVYECMAEKVPTSPSSSVTIGEGAVVIGGTIVGGNMTTGGRNE